MAWLQALFVCPLAPDGEAVEQALRRRGMHLRGVPTYGARRASTAATPSGNVGVIVTGSGVAAARRCAAFWAPNTDAILVVSAGIGTGLVPPGTVVVEGDASLVDRAVAAGTAGTPVVRGRVATVTNPTETGEAQSSLAAIGFAAADSEAGPWRDAARPARQPVMLARALLRESGGQLAAHRLLRAGDARPRWDRVLRHALTHPGEARVWRRAATLAVPIRAAATEAAVAAVPSIRG